MSIQTKLFLGVLFLLAAVGLFVTLQTEPGAFFISIAIAVGILYLLNRFLLNRKTEKGDLGYQRALRAQKKKNKLNRSDLRKLTRLRKPSRKHQFRVIEGNKGKNGKDKQNKSKTNIR